MRSLIVLIFFLVFPLMPSHARGIAELEETELAWEYEGKWEVDVQYRAAISHDGSQIAIGHYSNSQSNDIDIYDFNSRQFLSRLAVGSPFGTDMRYSPNQNLLASTQFQARAIIWNPPNTEPVAIISRENVTSNAAAFSPDGAYLAIGWSDGLIQIWDVQNQAILREVSNDETFYINRLLFSPDGRYLFSAGNKLLLWDAHDWQLINLLGVPSSSTIAGAAFSPDGSRLVTVYLDEAIQVYTLPNGEAIELMAGDAANPMPPTNPVITNDGRFMLFAVLARDVSRNDYDIHVYDLETLRYIGYILGDDVFRQLILSPDSQRVYAVSLGGIHSWRIGD